MHVTAQQLKDNSYVDDIGLTGGNEVELRERVKEADIILKHANIHIKEWIFSGNSTETVGIGDLSNNVPIEDIEMERMLGISWDPSADVFRFQVRINLSTLKKKSRVGPDITRQQLLEDPPTVITRRQFYSQIQSLFDPIGLLTALTCIACCEDTTEKNLGKRMREVEMGQPVTF